MKYLSLFSGIGGFEVAIHQFFGNKAECVGFSEIDKHAIEEYQRHYPNHKNLGDVTKIKKKDIDKLGKIDLIVAGFPCNDLSSANHKNKIGLNGNKSGLFWNMLKIIKQASKKNQNMNIIIENNVSMGSIWRDIITSELKNIFRKNVYCNYFDSSKLIVQRRRRYYWTLYNIPEYIGPKLQKFNNVLIPLKDTKDLNVPSSIKEKKNERIADGIGSLWDINSDTFKKCDYKTRWNTTISKIEDGFVRCITTVRNDNLFLETRSKIPFIRYFSKKEINTLFTFPENYVKNDTHTIYQKLYGSSVIPIVVFHVLKHLINLDLNNQ